MLAPLTPFSAEAPGVFRVYAPAFSDRCIGQKDFARAMM